MHCQAAVLSRHELSTFSSLLYFGGFFFAFTVECSHAAGSTAFEG